MTKRRMEKMESKGRKNRRIKWEKRDKKNTKYEQMGSTVKKYH